MLWMTFTMAVPVVVPEVASYFGLSEGYFDMLERGSPKVLLYHLYASIGGAAALGAGLWNEARNVKRYYDNMSRQMHGERMRREEPWRRTLDQLDKFVREAREAYARMDKEDARWRAEADALLRKVDEALREDDKKPPADGRRSKDARAGRSGNLVRFPKTGTK